jgi:hypothetical protein
MIFHPQPTQRVPLALLKAPASLEQTLWSQLEPQQQKHLAQHWARLVQQILKPTVNLKEIEDAKA